MTAISEAPLGAAQIAATIRELILELAPNQTITTLKPEHRLVEDLDYHSLALMELAFTLEDEFSLDTIREEDIQRITTAADVERHVFEDLSRRSDVRVAAQPLA